MSALPPKADIGTQSRYVGFVPKADILKRGHPLDDCDVHSVQWETSSIFCLSGAKDSAKGSVKCAAYHSRTIEGGHRNDDTDGGYGCQFRSRENSV